MNLRMSGRLYWMENRTLGPVILTPSLSPFCCSIGEIRRFKLYLLQLGRRKERKIKGHQHKGSQPC